MIDMIHLALPCNTMATAIQKIISKENTLGIASAKSSFGSLASFTHRYTVTHRRLHTILNRLTKCIVGGSGADSSLSQKIVFRRANQSFTCPKQTRPPLYPYCHNIVMCNERSKILAYISMGNSRQQPDHNCSSKHPQNQWLAKARSSCANDKQVTSSKVQVNHMSYLMALHVDSSYEVFIHIQSQLCNPQVL